MITLQPDPWKITEVEFLISGKPAEQLKFLLNYAVLAPSGHNSQPWLFKISRNMVELYMDKSRSLQVVDPFDREMVISCGAALFNLSIAIRHFRYTPEVEYFPSPTKHDLLARVRLDSGLAPTDEEDKLFWAIQKRHTNRHPFEGRKVERPLLLAIRKAASKEGARLHLVDKMDIKHKIADLVAEGDRLQWSDKLFRRELAAWANPNQSKRHDGIPVYAFGVTGPASFLMPSVIRTLNLGGSQSKKDYKLAEAAPVLAILGTASDTVQDWLKAGQALQHVLLRARAEGIWASFLNQPIEIAGLRSRLRDFLGRRYYPQIILRMGYGKEVKPTPRRVPSDVIMDR